MHADGILIGRVARILVASCPGCVELGRASGVPVVHVDVAVDPAAAIRSLNDRGRDDGADPGGPGDAGIGSAWRDWVEVAYPSDDPSPAEGDGREGVLLGDGRLWVVMPPGVTVGDFRLRLRHALRRREVGEGAGRRRRRDGWSGGVSGSWPWIRPSGGGRRGWREAEASPRLYAFDLVAEREELFRRVVAARRRSSR